MKLFGKIISAAMLSLLLSFAAQAESWSCRHGDDVREVHVETVTPDPVPCNVVYRKLTEGVEDQVLWSAQFDESYCENKAIEFAAKLQTLGWTCVETIRDPLAE
jgi:hypothetical protein